MILPFAGDPFHNGAWPFLHFFFGYRFLMHFGRPLAPFGRPFGSLWAPFGFLLAPFGVILAPFDALIGPSWRPLAHCWILLAVRWLTFGRFGQLFVTLGSILVPLRFNLLPFRYFWSFLCFFKRFHYLLHPFCKLPLNFYLTVDRLSSLQKLLHEILHSTRAQPLFFLYSSTIVHVLAEILH